MRGNRETAVRHIPSEHQSSFRGLTRHRRSKIAELAKTTLVKADQWGRGEAVGKELAGALDGAFATIMAAKKKK